MFTIGEFSKLVGLTVKTLRFYHEEGLLVPAFVDPDTSYRYYEPPQIETARAINYLRGLEFPVSDIRELLRGQGDEDSLEILKRQQLVLKDRIKRLRKAAVTLEQFIADESQARSTLQAAGDVQEKTLQPLLVGAIRIKGAYSECSRGFATIGRRFGRFICGPPLILHHDAEYREGDADFEACFPLRQGKADPDVSVRVLPGCSCVSLTHKGPYNQLGRSYAKVLQHAKQQGYEVSVPTREVYLKCAGMIFKGNPKNYLTEIQLPIENKGNAK